MEQPEFKNELKLKYNQIDVYLTTNQTEVHIKENGQYELPEKKLFWIFRRPNRGTYVAKIEVNEEVNNKLELRKNPFSCSFKNTQEYSEKCKFTLNGEKNVNFSIKFDPSSITDCKETKLTEDLVFDLPFKLSIIKIEKRKDGKEEEVVCDEKEDHIQVVLKELTPKPIVTFTPNEEVVKDGKIKYQEITDQTCIGTITIKHNAKFTAAPTLKNCNIKFQLMDSDNNNCLFDITDGIHINSSTSISIDQLNPNQTEEYHVYLEKKNTYNPLRDSERTFYYTYNKTTKELKPSITILRDNTITEGSVLLNVPGQKPLELYQKYDEKAIILKHILHNDTRFNDNIIHIVFQNLATESANSKAGVYIWGITLDKKITEGEERLKLTNEQSFDDFVTIEKPTGKGIHRLAGNKNRLDYQITFKKELLKATLPAPNKNETYIEIEFELKYSILVDKEGELYRKYMAKKYEEIKHDIEEKTTKFKIKLCKECSPTIYCVDFGTSAITAGSFSFNFNNRKDQYNSINLLEKKEQFIRCINPKCNEFDTEPSPFINSRIYFNETYFTNKKEKPRYDYFSGFDELKDIAEDSEKYPVYFSPRPNQLNPDHELPNLKTMIGHKNIPIAIGENTWTYKDKTGNTQNVFNEDGTTNCPLFNTTELFKISYRQLFTHFINPPQNEGYNRQINKLVVTVPNTYTPKNIQDVKNIIRETIPTVYPEHLCFISESDAVACYYIDKKPLNDGEKETVLIYDMGAGTLDLTLLERNRQGDRENVNIIKKIGINIAGNYLDYTILLILADLLKREGEASDILEANVLLNLNQTKEKPYNYAQAKTRDGLKNLTKELKTRLNDCTPANEESQTQKESPVDNVLQTHPNNDTNEESQTQKEDQYIKTVRDAVKNIKLNEILEHKFFKDEFLEYVTTDVFKNFLGGSKTFNIDVVVFSGRSTSLNAIRNAVQEKIKGYCNNSEQIKYASIADKEIILVDDVNNINTGADMLKSIVAKGACVYMKYYFNNSNFKSRANYTSFGIITHGRNNKKKYFSIINKCADYNEQGIVQGEKTINIKKEGVAAIELVQSYSEKTEKDYQNDVLGLISPLIYMEGNLLKPDENGECTFKLTLNDQIIKPDKNVLEFHIGDDIIAKLEPREDFNSDTLRKSLWPVIFN